MAITMLKPRLQALKTTSRIKVLDAKAGSTQRIRGDTWMATRRRIMQRDGFACACCGAVRMDHDVDHVVPLEQGGSNDDDNMQLLCSGPGGCHARKTASEAKSRAGR